MLKLLKLGFRICPFCVLEYDKAGHSPLASVYYSPSSTYSIHIFLHVIALSMDQICNSALICFLPSSILFPFISILLPIYVAASLNK